MKQQSSLSKAIFGVTYDADPLSVEPEEVDRENRGRLVLWMLIAIAFELALVASWVFAVTTEII